MVLLYYKLKKYRLVPVTIHHTTLLINLGHSRTLFDQIKIKSWGMVMHPKRLNKLYKFDALHDFVLI